MNLDITEQRETKHKKSKKDGKIQYVVQLKIFRICNLYLGRYLGY
jgi:hypothetical protein